MSWQAVLLEVWRHGQRLSAVGPGPVQAHLDHGLALAAQLEPPSVGVDIGSGAGIPGLVLAGTWPDSRWLLVEAAARRAELLHDAVQRLDWSARVEVCHGRAEDLARDPRWRGRADLVTARSFGPPAVAAECGAGFLSATGVLVVTEPPDDPDGRRWPADGLARLGLRTVASPGRSPRWNDIRVQRLVLIDELPDDVPRRAGMPAKRPRFTGESGPS